MNIERSKTPIFVIGVFLLLLSITVISGWLSSIVALRTILPSFPSVHFPAAIGLLLISISLIYNSLSENCLKFPIGIVCLLYGLVLLIEQIFNISPGIFSTSGMNEIVFYEPLCIFLSGLFCLYCTINQFHRIRNSILILIASSVTVISIISLIGYFIGIETIFYGGKYFHVSPITSFSFVLSSIGNLRLARNLMDGKTWLYSSIRRKLLFFTILPVFLIFIFLATYSLAKIRFTRSNEIKSYYNEVAFRMAEQYNHLLLSIEQQARSARRSLQINDHIREAEIHRLLRQNLEDDSSIYGSTITFAPYKFSENKRLYAPYIYREGDSLKIIDIGNESYDYTSGEWEWYTKPKELLRSIWTEPYFDEGAGNIWMSTYSVPFYSNYEFAGVVTVDVPLNALQELINYTSEEGLHVTVFTQSGMFLYSSYNKDFIGKKFEDVSHFITSSDSLNEKLINAIHAGVPGSDNFYSPAGNKYLMFYSPISSSGWMLVLSVPESTVMKPVKIYIYQFAVVFLMVLFLIGLTIYLASRKLLKQISDLTQSSLQLSLGKFDTSIELDSHDEIGTLSQSLAKMAHDIQERLKELRCLLNISQLTTEHDLEFEDVYQKSVELLPESWQYPEHTCGRIVIQGKEYSTSNFDLTQWFQSAVIYADSLEIGKIEVYYLKKMPDSDIGPFMKEEQDLIEALAKQLGNYYVRKSSEQALYEHHEKLEEIVKLRTTELSEMEERSRLLLESAGEGIFGVDQNGKITFLNPRASEMLQFSIEELLGEDIHQKIHHSFADGTPYPPAECPMYHAFKNNKTMHMDGEVLWRKDNTCFPVEYTSTPILKNGDVVGSVITFLDISERKDAEKALLDSRNRINAILEASSNGIVTINSSGIIETFNPAAEQIFGYESQKILGKDVKILMPDDIADIHHEYIRRYLETGAANVIGKRVEVTAKRKNGELFPIEIGITRVDINGSVIFNASINDISERRRAEIKIRESEKRFRTLTENIPGMVYRCAIDENWTMFFLTDAVEEITGYPASDFINNKVRSYASIIHPEDIKIVDKVVDDSIEMQIPFEVEYRIIDAKESIHWVYERGVLVKSEDGQEEWLDGFVLDITDRKNAENELRKLSSVVEFSPLSILITDLNGIVQYVNPHFTKVTGYTFDEAMGEMPDILKSEYHDEKFNKQLWNTILSGQTWQGEFKTKIKNGDIIWESGSVSPLKLPDGTITHFIVIREDITQRKEAREALKQAKEIAEKSRDDLQKQHKNLLNLIEELPLASAYFEPGGKVHHMNKKFIQLLGYTIEDIPHLDKHWELFYPDPEIREQNRIEWTASIEVSSMTGHPAMPLSADVTGKNGHVHKVEIHTIQVGELALSILVDLTHRIKIEEELKEAKETAEAATKAKGDFLANMSHEIRTPMNAIIGLSHLTLKTDLDTKQKDFVQKIYSSAQNLLGIINDILDFSKIEAGKLELESIEFDIEDTLSNLASLISHKAYEKSLELLVYALPDVPTALIGDPLRIGQILLNLAGNAIKFTEKGEINVVCSLEKMEEDHAILRFDVKDTGIGMTADQTKSLFEAFQQADTSITRKYGGTGLGLSISKLLTEMMGGKIWVKSESGVGSTFSFTIKVDVQSKSKQTSFLIADDFKNMKVLVVDDSESAREIMGTMLESFSFRVEYATNGQEAIDSLKKCSSDDPFKLVMMDWRMPVMDGLTAAQKIKLDSQLKDISTIIMVTAYGHEEISREKVNKELDGFLLKPVSQSKIFNAIMMAFNQKDKIVDTHAGFRASLDVDVSSISGAEILVVEDNLINQQVAQEILTQKGFSVSLAENGEEAVNKIGNESFDCVLMDVQMPVMDGYTTTKFIREDLGMHELPVIAMTAHALAGDREKSLEAGMNDHVTKPIKPEELFNALLKWIKPDPNRHGKAAIQTTQKSNDDDFIPELKNIDTIDGLERLGGNKKLYWSILEKFKKEFSDYTEQIRSLLNNRQDEEAQRYAHSIKGVAGNIGAKTLNEVSAKIEELIKNGKIKQAQKILPEFKEQLNKILDEISPLLEKRATAHKPDVPVVTGTEAEKLDLLNKLLAEVKTRKPKKCEPLVEELKHKSWEINISSEIQRLEKLIKRYKFKEAKELIEKYLEEYKQ